MARKALWGFHIGSVPSSSLHHGGPPSLANLRLRSRSLIEQPLKMQGGEEACLDCRHPGTWGEGKGSVHGRFQRAVMSGSWPGTQLGLGVPLNIHRFIKRRHEALMTDQAQNAAPLFMSEHRRKDKRWPSRKSDQTSFCLGQ